MVDYSAEYKEIVNDLLSFQKELNTRLVQVSIPQDMSNMDLQYLLWIKDMITRQLMSSSKLSVLGDLEVLGRRYCQHNERKSSRNPYTDYLDHVKSFLDYLIEKHQ